MARRYTDYDPELLRRAAELARLPGVRRKEACDRFGLSTGMLRRAVRELGAAGRPGPRAIVLHALTEAGTRLAGELPNLAKIGSYVDFVNKDGMTAEGVQAILDGLVDDGTLEIEAGTFRLMKPFP